MKNQKKIGVILSYLNIVLHMGISIFFTPFLIKSLGDAEYGVYRIVQSFAGQLAIITFGMSALVTRNISYFDAKGQKKEKENFLFMAIVISALMAVVVFGIGMLLYSFSDQIFQNSFSVEEMAIAKKLLWLFIINVTFVVLNDGFSGILTGHEQFVVSNGVKTLRFLFRILILIVLVNLGVGSVAIIATDLGLTIATFLFNLTYSFGVLKEKVKFHYFDKKLFRTSLVFSVAVLFQALINQVNQNMDSMILGIMTTPEIVTMYSIALTIYTMYNSLSMGVSLVFIPHTTKMVARGASQEELSDMVGFTGRYALMISGLILSAFIIFGKEFLCLWMGESYLSAYTIALILMIPMTIPLLQNTCECILDAYMKRMHQSFILLTAAFINVTVSVVLIRFVGYIGAAIGTATSVVVGYILMMNVYYSKNIGLNIKKIFKTIFYKLLPCLLFVTLLGIPLQSIKITSNPVISFGGKLVIYITIYIIVIYRYGMNQNEKNTFCSLVKKLIHPKEKSVSNG